MKWNKISFYYEWINSSFLDLNYILIILKGFRSNVDFPLTIKHSYVINKSYKKDFVYK